VSLHTFPDELDSFKQSLRFGLLAAALALIKTQFDFLKQTQANTARNLRHGDLGRSLFCIG